MKTAVQHIQECLHILDDGKEPTYAELWLYIEDLPEVMKEYAKQVAEQALKDAAEKATVELVWEWDGENEYQTNGGVDKDSILSTPIQTP